jgi:hypothetical protein
LQEGKIKLAYFARLKTYFNPINYYYMSEVSNFTQPYDPMIYTGLKFSTSAPKETKSFLAQYAGLGHILFSLLFTH